MPERLNVKTAIVAESNRVDVSDAAKLPHLIALEKSLTLNSDDRGQSASWFTG